MRRYPFRPSITDRLMVKALRKALPPNQRRLFDASLVELLKGEIQYFTDRATNGHILFVAAVLCLYRSLRRIGHSDPAAKAIIRRSLRGLGRKSTAFIIWATCALTRDSFQTIRKYSRDRAKNAYGPTFQISESDIDQGFVSEVHVCGYRTFLARHQALDLTEVLCEWDSVWIDALPNTIAFRRPTTLALGGKSCRFEFRQK